MFLPVLLEGTWHFLLPACPYSTSTSFLTISHKNMVYRNERGGNARDSHSGGPWFESRCRPTWLLFFVVFLNHPGKCWFRFSLPRSIWPLFIKFIYLISLSKFNLQLIGTFTSPTPPGPYRTKTCRGRELNYGSHNTFLSTQGHGGSPQMSDQPNAGAAAETAQTWKTIHTKHTRSHPNKATAKWYSGTLGA